MNASHNTSNSNTNAAVIDRPVHDVTTTDPTPTNTTHADPPKGDRKWSVVGSIAAVVVFAGGGLVALNSLATPESTPVEVTEFGQAQRLIEQSINDAVAEQSVSAQTGTAQQLIQQSINDALAGEQNTYVADGWSEMQILESLAETRADRSAENVTAGVDSTVVESGGFRETGLGQRMGQANSTVVESGGFRETGLGQRMVQAQEPTVGYPTGCPIQGPC